MLGCYLTGLYYITTHIHSMLGCSLIDLYYITIHTQTHSMLGCSLISLHYIIHTHTHRHTKYVMLVSFRSSLYYYIHAHTYTLTKYAHSKPAWSSILLEVVRKNKEVSLKFLNLA